MSETPILMAIDTSKIQSQGTFPQLNTSFDKSFNQMSPAKRMIVAISLQAQASRELTQFESKKKKLIEKIVKVLEQVVPKLQLDANDSSSGKLQYLVDHISTQFDSLTKALTRHDMDKFKDARIQIFW